MAGVQAFYVADEPVPPWWTAQREAQTWRSLAAYGRWSRARKQWAVDSGADYVATFYPHWRQHGAAS